MKRIFTGVLAALLILVLGTTNAYAVLSPEAEAALERLAETYLANVSSATATTSDKTMSLTVDKASINLISEAKGIADSKGNVAEIYSIVDLRLAAAVSASTVAKGVNVGLAISGVRSGDNVYIFHKRSSDSSWETLKPSFVGNGYLEVKMYSFSPVAVVRYQSNVVLTPTPQDTSAEEKEQAELEAQSLAANLRDDISVSPSTSAGGTIVQPTKSNATVADVAYVKGQASMLGGTVLGMANYTTSTSSSVLAKGIQVTLRVSDLKAGDNVYILHKRSNGWETLKPYSVVNGYLAVKMYSLSPIAVVRYPTGVILTTTEQDTSAEEQAKEEQEVQELAGNITSVSGTASGTKMSITKANALMSDVAFAKAQVAPAGGTILGMASFTTTTAASAVAKGVQVTIGVSDLKAGDNAYVLHRLSDGSWETLKPYSIVNGFLEVKMYSLSAASPIAVVRYPAGVNITPTIQDTSAEEQEKADQEAKDLAAKVTNFSASAYAGNLVLTKNISWTSDVVYVKGQAALLNGVVLGMADFTTTADSSLVAGGVEVTLYISDVKTGDNVYVWHKHSTGAWEILKPYSIGNGYVGVKMYSLSSIAVVRYPAGVTFSTSSQDTPTVTQPEAGKEAQDFADRITLASAISSTGTNVTMIKGTASTADVALAKGIAQPWGATILGMAEFTTTAASNMVANGIMASLYVSDLKVGDNIYVLHKLSDGTWETIKPYVIGTGYVTFRLYSLSPIVVVRYPAGVVITPTQQIPSNGNDGTYPGTGTYYPGTYPGTGTYYPGTYPGTGTYYPGTYPGTGTYYPGTYPGTGTYYPGTYPNYPSGGNGGDQSNSQTQTNDNNQSNSQSNNQNNPVNVNQNVTVNYPETGQYNNGYGEGFKDGFNAGKKTGTSTAKTKTSTSSNTVKSPKTDAGLPALPFIAMFAAAGLVVCKKKNS